MEYLRADFRRPEVKRDYIDYIKSLDGEYEILHYQTSPRREISANKFYHVVVKMIAEEIGEPKLKTHQRLKELYSHIVKADPNASDTTTKMNREQFFDFIDCALIYFYDLTGRDLDVLEFP